MAEGGLKKKDWENQLKYIVIKGWGDKMQVIWILIMMLDDPTRDICIITNDGVVLTLCITLNVPCIYTGASKNTFPASIQNREPSKKTTSSNRIVHYNPKSDPVDVFLNKRLQELNFVITHNQAMIEMYRTLANKLPLTLQTGSIEYDTGGQGQNHKTIDDNLKIFFEKTAQDCEAYKHEAILHRNAQHSQPVPPPGPPGAPGAPGATGAYPLYPNNWNESPATRLLLLARHLKNASESFNAFSSFFTVDLSGGAGKNNFVIPVAGGDAANYLEMKINRRPRKTKDITLLNYINESMSDYPSPQTNADVHKAALSACLEQAEIELVQTMKQIKLEQILMGKSKQDTYVFKSGNKLVASSVLGYENVSGIAANLTGLKIHCSLSRNSSFADLATKILRGEVTAFTGGGATGNKSTSDVYSRTSASSGKDFGLSGGSAEEPMRSTQQFHIDNAQSAVEAAQKIVQRIHPLNQKIMALECFHNKYTETLQGAGTEEGFNFSWFDLGDIAAHELDKSWGVKWLDDTKGDHENMHQCQLWWMSQDLIGNYLTYPRNDYEDNMPDGELETDPDPRREITDLSELLNIALKGAVIYNFDDYKNLFYPKSTHPEWYSTDVEGGEKSWMDEQETFIDELKKNIKYDVIDAWRGNFPLYYETPPTEQESAHFRTNTPPSTLFLYFMCYVKNEYMKMAEEGDEMSPLDLLLKNELINDDRHLAENIINSLGFKYQYFNNMLLRKCYESYEYKYLNEDEDEENWDIMGDSRMSEEEREYAKRLREHLEEIRRNVEEPTITDITDEGAAEEKGGGSSQNGGMDEELPPTATAATSTTHHPGAASESTSPLLPSEEPNLDKLREKRRSDSNWWSKSTEHIDDKMNDEMEMMEKMADSEKMEEADAEAAAMDTTRQVVMKWKAMNLSDLSEYPTAAHFAMRVAIARTQRARTREEEALPLTPPRIVSSSSSSSSSFSHHSMDDDESVSDLHYRQLSSLTTNTSNSVLFETPGNSQEPSSPDGLSRQGTLDRAAALAQGSSLSAARTLGQTRLLMDAINAPTGTPGGFPEEGGSKKKKTRRRKKKKKTKRRRSKNNTKTRPNRRKKRTKGKKRRKNRRT